MGPLKSMALDTLQVENQTWLTGEDEELQPISLVSLKFPVEVTQHLLVHLVHVHASDYHALQRLQSEATILSKNWAADEFEEKLNRHSV